MARTWLLVFGRRDLVHHGNRSNRVCRRLISRRRSARTGARRGGPGVELAGHRIGRASPGVRIVGGDVSGQSGAELLEVRALRGAAQRVMPVTGELDVVEVQVLIAEQLARAHTE